MKVGLKYVGRKELPFTFGCPKLKKPLQFTEGKKVVYVTEEEAEFIFKYNPYGFVKRVDEPEEVVEEVKEEIVEIEDKPDLTCPVCHKQYSDKMWYDRHLEKCLGKEGEDDS